MNQYTRASDAAAMTVGGHGFSMMLPGMIVVLYPSEENLPTFEFTATI